MNNFPSKPSMMALAFTALAAMGAFFWSPPAQAQMAVAVVTCMAVPGVPCASSLDVNGVTTAVGATNTQLGYTHSYLTTGVGGSPGGVIALLGGINERLGMVTNANDEAVENDDLAARQRIYDERMMDERGSRIPKPSNVRRACVQATSASGRAGAARATGGASRAAGGAAGGRYDDDRPQIQALVDAGSKRGELGVCSASDVENRRPGCQSGGVGERPSADVRTSSLFDGGVRQGPVNLSIDDQGFKIGQQLISNVAPLPLDKPTNEQQRDSQGGVIYMLNYNRYAARASTATDAMADILGFGVAMNVEGASMDGAQAEPFLRTWASNQAEYEQIFGAGTFPAVPSERELLRFSVFKHYAGVQDKQKSAAMSPEDREQAQIELMAINNRVQFELLQRQEKTNALLSAILAQQMDPITSMGMKGDLAGLAGQRKADQQ